MYLFRRLSSDDSLTFINRRADEISMSWQRPTCSLVMRCGMAKPLLMLLRRDVRKQIIRHRLVQTGNTARTRLIMLSKRLPVCVICVLNGPNQPPSTGWRHIFPVARDLKQRSNQSTFCAPHVGGTPYTTKRYSIVGRASRRGRVYDNASQQHLFLLQEFIL